MIKIKIIDRQNNNLMIKGTKGDTLYHAFADNNIIFNGNCGGNGVCGACKVYLCNKNIETLACKHILTDDLEVKVNFLLDNTLETMVDDAFGIDDYSSKKTKSKKMFLSIDVGTTTIAFLLFDIEGTVLGECHITNSQRKYGSDVASRISFANNKENYNLLRKAVWNDIFCGIKKLDSSITSIDNILINGNTTMLNIIKNDDISSIGVYPFGPNNIEQIKKSLCDIYYGDNYEYFKNVCNTNSDDLLIFTPCKSGYFGGDALLGAVYSNLCNDDKTDVFIDLGTNGEMLIGNKNKAYCTSTACGPAFEKSLLKIDKLGSSGIDLLCKYLDRHIISKNGKIIDRFLEQGIPLDNGLFLTQDIIRDIQLAKAAICTGFNILVEKMNIDISEIRHVYIAGGFGEYVNYHNMCKIGMLPQEVENTIKMMGNTSLYGGKNYILDEDFYNKTCKLMVDLRYIDLSDEDHFSQNLLSVINFQ